MGVNIPGSALIPKGVVHCYRCISVDPGLVINFPDQHFMGQAKASPIDEIRHEGNASALKNPMLAIRLPRGPAEGPPRLRAR